MVITHCRGDGREFATSWEMKTSKVLDKVKQVIVGIVLTGLLALVPFYFESKAMTEDNRAINVRQDSDIAMLEEEAKALNLEVAVEQAERKHNKEALERIERKLDELIKEVKSLD